MLIRQIRAQLANNVNIVRYFDQVPDSSSIIQRGNATDLNKFTTYALTIRAYNSAGSSPWSSSVRSTTLEDSKLSKLMLTKVFYINVNCQNLSGNKISLID